MTPQDLMMLSMKQRIEYIAPLIQKYESPISVPVRIAQAIQESAIFTSELAQDANNGFGIKASAPWTGVTHSHVSGEHVNGKNVKEKSLFRKYPNIEASIKDHAAFFTSTEFRKSDVAYGLAIKATTYEEEAKNLGPKFPGDKSYYAGDPNYASSLMKHIKNYNLAKYDTRPKEKEQDKMAYPKPKMTDRRKQALGYPGHGIYARRAKSAIKNIVWHYTATTHAGNGANIIKNHENYWKNTHGWDIGGYHYYIDRQGNIFWNYDLEIATYGAGKANPYSMHISLEASSVSNYTAAQIKAREDLTLWLITSELPHLGGNSMRGHKEMPGNSTSCPGYSVAQLNEFRKGLSRKADQDWNGAETDKDDITVSKSGKYTVNHGDTLWAIAQAHGQTVAQLQEWNGIADGQWLKTGQVVYVTAPKQNSYTVKKGDSLWAIGQMHDVTVDQIKEWNDLKTNLIYSGQELFVSDPDAKNVKDPEPEQEVEKVEEQPKEDNPKVPAIELKENQLMDWKGNIYARISK